MSGLWQQFSQWYLSVLGDGGYWLIGALMALESTFVPIPSEIIIPPAAYLAHTQGQLSVYGIVAAGTLGSWVGAALMYWGARLLGRPFMIKFGPYVGIAAAKIEKAESWAAHYGTPGVFFSRLLPVIRHLIGIPAGGGRDEQLASGVEDPFQAGERGAAQFLPLLVHAFAISAVRRVGEVRFGDGRPLDVEGGTGLHLLPGRQGHDRC